MAKLGTWLRNWPICWWSAGGQLPKAGSEGVSTIDTPSWLDFKFSMLNNLDIGCVSGYFTIV